MASIDSLKVLLWNANGIRSRVPEISSTLSSRNVDIFCLNESRLRNDEFVDIKGYKFIRNNRIDRGGGGVAIFIKTNLDVVEFHCDTVDRCEIAYLDIRTEKRKLRIATIYCPPAIPLSENALKQITLKGFTILCGDLNAKHPAFGCLTANSNGNALLRLLPSSGFTMLSTGTPTHTATNCTRDQLDVFLCSSELLKFVSSPLVLDNHGSDHEPVLLSYSDGAAVRGLSFYPEHRKDYSRANWDLYQQIRDDALLDSINPDKPICSQKDVDDLLKSIVFAIDEGSKTAIPVVKANELKVAKVTPEILEAIRRRNKLGRLASKYRVVYYRRAHNAARQEVDRLFKVQSDEWTCKKQRDSLSKSNAGSAAFWQTVKSVASNTAATPARELKTIDNPSGGAPGFTDATKSELFAKHLESVFSPRSDLNLNFAEQNNLEILKRCVQSTEELKPSPDLGLHDPGTSCRRVQSEDLITPGDVIGAIKGLKMKSPGADQIHNTLLKRYSLVFIFSLVHLFQSVLRTGYVPSAWKHAEIVMIPKPGKDPKTVKGYRPISLLPSIGKLFDKIATYKIRDKLMSLGWFMAEQSGFLRLHGCPDHLYRLSRDGAEAMQDGEETTVVSLDVEAAFDTIDHDILRFLLCQTPLHRLWKRYLSENLALRTFCIRVKSAFSSIKLVRAGVPQGGVSSPTMFTIFSNDLFRKVNDPDIRKGLLADDVLLWLRGTRTTTGRKLVKRRIESTLDVVSDWYRQHGLKLNASKTQAIRLSLAREDESIKIVFQGIVLEWQLSLKYLGVIFDKRLTFGPQIKSMCAKTSSRLICLRRLRGKRIRLPSAKALSVYKSFLRPILEYGCEAFISLSSCHMDTLQRIQNEALRICLGRNKYCSIRRLHQESEVEILSDRLQCRCIRFTVRAINNNTLVGSEMLNDLRDATRNVSRKSVVSPTDVLRPLLAASARQ